MLALRGLVPAGYMLSLPGDGSLDWALHLCPLQNRSLDVNALRAEVSAAHHGHAAGDPAPATADRTHVSVTGECAAWLDSAAPALAASPALTAQYTADSVRFFAPDTFVNGRLYRHPGQARAPPSAV